MESGRSVSGINSIDSNEDKSFQAMRLENPFTFKVGQIFTGFGIGCGAGIGVGRPINLGAIPMLNQVMSATRGATDAFSGVSRHVNNSLRKLGAKNVEVGIGCGVGFGHGFGVGLAVKPGVLHQIQANLVIAMRKMMIKLGIAPKLPFGQGALPSSLQGSIGMINAASNPSSMGNAMHLSTKALDQKSQGPTGSSVSENVPIKGKAVDTAFGSRTEKVLNDFLQNPLVKGEGDANDEAVRTMKSMLDHNLFTSFLDDMAKENYRNTSPNIVFPYIYYSPSTLFFSGAKTFYSFF